MCACEALIILCVVLLLTGLIAVQVREKNWGSIVAGSLALITGIHFFNEGYHWQMIGIYVLSAVLLILHAVQFIQKKERRITHKALHIAGFAVGLLVVITSIALMFALPVLKIPAPAGPYQVGSVVYHWVDESRPGVYTDADAPRELMVEIWYPAEPDPRAVPAKWLDDPEITAPMLAYWGDLPEFMLSHLNLATTNTYRDAPIAGEGGVYPVVVYVHGWGGMRNINQDQIEALASQGYVVVSAEHTYGNLVTVFPDGRAEYNNPDALPEDAPDEEYDEAAALLVETYAEDITFTLDQLEVLNEADPDHRFTGRLNVEQVGIFGHSTGGGAMVRACAEDARCAAMFGQDAWVEPVPEEMLAQSLSQPTALFNSENWTKGENADAQKILLDGLSVDGYLAGIEGTSHYDFVMVPLFSPLSHQLGLKGPLPADRVTAINQNSLVAFFDYYLKGDHSTTLIEAMRAFDEVSIEKFTP